MTTHTTVSRRESPSWQIPRWLGFTTTIMIIAIAIAVLVLVAVIAGVVSFAPAKTADAGAQMRPVENQAQPVQAPIVAQAPAPAPQAPVPAVSQDNGAAVPAPANWPLVRVDWHEVTPTPGVYLLNPIQGDGFYTGTMNTPVGFSPTSEGLAFIARVLPKLKGIGGMVAAARDKNIVFVSITGYDNQSYLFISRDGEKSWYRLNLAPVQSPVAGSHAVRVKVEGDSISLNARDNVVGEKWWGATIKMSDLLAP